MHKQVSAEHSRESDRQAWVVLAVLCAIDAAAAIRRIVALEAVQLSGPAALVALDEHFRSKTGMVLLHIVPSLLFVLLVPVQFVSSLRRNRPQLHHWIGRMVFGLGIVIGISALSLSAHPVGGISESTATTFFGCFFLFSLGKAWWHVRNRRIELHREWVTRMTAISAGVATTRPIIGVFFATSPLTGLTPQQFFGPAMWLGFTATYVAGEAWIHHTKKGSGKGDKHLLASKEPAGDCIHVSQTQAAKMVVLAPMPSARVNIPTIVKPGRSRRFTI